MFFKTKANKNNSDLFEIEKELNEMLEDMKNGNLDVRGNENFEVFKNINAMLDILKISYENKPAETKIEKEIVKDKNLERECEKLKDRLKVSMKMSQIGLWDLEFSGDPSNPTKKFNWSDEFRHLLGFTDENDFPNELSSWADRIHPDDYDRVMKAFNDHIKDSTGKTPYSLNYRTKLKNGEYKWFHAEGETARDSSGAPISVLGSINDITYLKEKEAKSIELSKKMEDLTASISEIVKSIDGIAVTAQDLAVSQESTMKASEEMKLATDETKKITEFLKNLAGETNLLGINASIEAARSGKEGLGFNVVANQIRKLSQSSEDGVKQIENSIKGMNDSVEKIVKSIENVNSIAQTQASATEEVNAYVEELNSNAEELLETAKEVSK